MKNIKIIFIIIIILIITISISWYSFSNFLFKKESYFDNSNFLYSGLVKEYFYINNGGRFNLLIEMDTMNFKKTVNNNNNTFLGFYSKEDSMATLFVNSDPFSIWTPLSEKSHSGKITQNIRVIVDSKNKLISYIFNNKTINTEINVSSFYQNEKNQLQNLVSNPIKY